MAGERKVVLAKVGWSVVVSVIEFGTIFFELLCLDKGIGCGGGKKTRKWVVLFGTLAALIWDCVYKYRLKKTTLTIHRPYTILEGTALVAVFAAFVFGVASLIQGYDEHESEDEVDGTVVAGLLFKFVAGVLKEMSAVLEDMGTVPKPAADEQPTRQQPRAQHRAASNGGGASDDAAGVGDGAVGAGGGADSPFDNTLNTDQA